MASPQKELKPGAAWSPYHRALFAPSFDHDEGAINALEWAIKNNTAELCNVVDDGKTVGAFAFIISDDKEMEILGAGSISTENSFGLVVPFIEAEARRRDCVGINVETFRRGLVKLFHDAGYRVIHVALWKGLKNGQ